MGMFNEVYANCPKCGRHRGGYAQIRQLVNGYGGFCLNEPSTLTDLGRKELRELSVLLRTQNLVCRLDPVSAVDVAVSEAFHDVELPRGCGHVFNPVTGEGYECERDAIIAEREVLIAACFPYARRS